ncbi:MAG: response regulator [Thalassotalea sp.]
MSKQKINVVYLDDEALLCEIFKEFLHSNEINITTFTDEKLAIAYCNRTKPELIFIDYRLKTQTGIEVAEAITHSAIKVLVTGELNVTSSANFHSVIEKPYKLAEIKNFIQSFVEV